MRINFSFSNEEQIETGVQRLAEVIREEIESK
jgi:DNA-binding transcriptional MocR family regulator